MKNMEPLAQTCMAQKMKPKILGKMHKPKINDKKKKKNEYRLFLLLTFTKEGDKITNANKMIYRVFVKCTKHKANRLTCFVRVRFLWQRFHRKGDKFRYVSVPRGKPVIRVLPRAKTDLCVLFI